MNSLVSVIIPYFKKKKFIKSSIKSATSQSYKNLEIIIIYDDESLEDLEYIKSLCLQDNRIKLIINKKNLGAGFSRNKGIKNSKGEYIAFLDADDLWKKNKIKFQYEFMKKNKIYFSHTSYEIVDNYDHKLRKMNIKENLSFNDLIKSCDICLSSVMIKKNILNNNKFSSQKTKEDYYLWLQLSKKNNIYGIKKFLTKWRNVSESLSSSFFQKIEDSIILYNKKMHYNFLVSIIFTLRLSFFYLLKRVKQAINN